MATIINKIQKVTSIRGLGLVDLVSRYSSSDFAESLAAKKTVKVSSSPNTLVSKTAPVQTKVLPDTKLSPATFASNETTGIKLDGDLSDWAASDRLDTSGGGVEGYALYGRYDAGNYYVAIAAPEGTTIGFNTTLWLNTDLNPETGYKVWGDAVGAEYNVNFDASGKPRLYTGSEGQNLVAGATVNYAYSANHQTVELSVLGRDIGNTQALSVYTDVNNTVYLPSSYSTNTYIVKAPVIQSPVTVGAVTLDGSLNDWKEAEHIDDVAPVNGYEVYGKTTGDSYVFALKVPAGARIGANTTFWLNTDRNANTGYKIWGTSGGAEYNINFDAAGIPHLYTGAAGQTPVAATVQYGVSVDGTVVELAIKKSSINNPKAVDVLVDVNESVYLPASYSGPQYTVIDAENLPPRTDFSKNVAIVYSDTTAARYFGNVDVNVNETAYSQLFMAAQHQATMAGVHYDLLTESDLKDINKLVNYDTIVFPAFQFAKGSEAALIADNLTLLAKNYKTSFIAAGNFMTADETGTALGADPYARMKALFDLAPQASGFSGTTSVAVKSTNTGFDGMGGYNAGESIRTYSNTSGVGWLSFGDATPGVAGTIKSIDTQTVTGTGAGIYDAVVTSSMNGNRNVHFSTEALLGDNNQLWQAITYAAKGATSSGVGLHMGRQANIFASRTDMDEAMFSTEVKPENGKPGIYDALMPIVKQWKNDFNFVSSYYIDIGDDPSQDEQTDWNKSLTYYRELLDSGNEIGSHSRTHLLHLNPSENTNILTTGTGPGTFDYEFRESRDIIKSKLGLTSMGAAVPGAPEVRATAEQILPYYDYLSGGFSSVGAGYPGAFGYMKPGDDKLGKVYLAPNMSFDFTLIEYKKMTPTQALAQWNSEFAALTRHSDVPVIVWPWHDYGPTNWDKSGYTKEMFTTFITAAANANSEFVTLADLAQRIRSFEKSSVNYAVNGNTITATVVSNDAGKFALDIDNLGTQKIASVAGWYAYDDDSVFTDRDGGSYTITLGSAAADVSHITRLGARNELVSLNGDGTNLNFTINGEGKMVVALKSGIKVMVDGATAVSQQGNLLTLDLGKIGSHTVSVKAAPDVPTTEKISVPENTTYVTTVKSGATGATSATSVTSPIYTLAGGADAAKFAIDSTTGILSFIASPDFEKPADTGKDNVYDVNVKITDKNATATSKIQAFTVTVTDVQGSKTYATSANDVLTGTQENDVFVWKSAADSGKGSTRDTITNFTSGVDKIDLGGFDANKVLFKNQHFIWDGRSSLNTAITGHLHYRWDKAANVTYVEGNTDANIFNMEFQIKLAGIHNMSGSDFIL